MGHAVDGDLVLLHDFQQGGLGFRAGTVDFVSKHDLAHDGTFLVFHLAGFEVDEGETGHVRGHQVRRKLDPAEGTVQGAGKSAGQRGLADAGDILDEDVAFAEEGDQRVFDRFLLADDSLTDILLKGEDHSAGIDHKSLLRIDGNRIPILIIQNDWQGLSVASLTAEKPVDYYTFNCGKPQGVV